MTFNSAVRVHTFYLSVFYLTFTDIHTQLGVSILPKDFGHADCSCQALNHQPSNYRGPLLLEHDSKLTELKCSEILGEAASQKVEQAN